MAITLGKVGKVAGASASSMTVSWTGGGSNTAGSTLLLVYTSTNSTADTVTTPTNWTLRASGNSSGGNLFVYEWVNANAISSQVLTTPAQADASTLDIIEFTGAGSLDSSTSIASSSGTTATTNGITTVAANTVLVGIFCARSATVTARTLSTPGTGFTQAQVNNQSSGNSTSQTSYITYDVVSATQSNKTTTCAINVSANYNALMLAYAQAAVGGPFPWFTRGMQCLDGLGCGGMRG